MLFNIIGIIFIFIAFCVLILILEIIRTDKTSIYIDDEFDYKGLHFDIILKENSQKVFSRPPRSKFIKPEVIKDLNK